MDSSGGERSGAFMCRIISRSLEEGSQMRTQERSTGGALPTGAGCWFGGFWSPFDQYVVPTYKGRGQGACEQDTESRDRHERYLLNNFR